MADVPPPYQPGAPRCAICFSFNLRQAAFWRFYCLDCGHLLQKGENSMNLTDLQSEVAIWSEKNFGTDPERCLHPLLGILEETGELCEAVAYESTISHNGPIQTAIETLILGQALWGRLAHRVLKAAQGIRGEKLEGMDRLADELDAVCARMEDACRRCGVPHELGAGDLTLEERRAARADAIGDIEIYLADFCRSNDLKLAEIVATTWQKVSKRDWRVDPQAGGTR